MTRNDEKWQGVVWGGPPCLFRCLSFPSVGLCYLWPLGLFWRVTCPPSLDGLSPPIVPPPHKTGHHASKNPGGSRIKDSGRVVKFFRGGNDYLFWSARENNVHLQKSYTLTYVRLVGSSSVQSFLDNWSYQFPIMFFGLFTWYPPLSRGYSKFLPNRFLAAKAALGFGLLVS